MRLKADLLLFMVAIIWGTAFVAQGIAGQYGIAYLYNGVSFMLAGVILIPFVPRGIQIPKAQWGWMLIAGVVLCVATALQQVGLIFTKVANASFLTSLYAVFTPFLLWIGIRERPHWIDLIAVSMAGIGAFMLSTGGQFQVQAGDSIEFTGSLFWALHFVVLGKCASKFESISFASGHFIVTRIYLMGYSMGARMTSAFLAEQPHPAVVGFIGVGVLEGGGEPLDANQNIRRLRLPVIDVYACKTPLDLRSAENRQSLVSASYKQVSIEGADHSFHGYDSRVAQEIIAWLKEQEQKR